MFSCYIIGDDNITIQCASMILAKRHILFGMVSTSFKIKNWCEENAIPHFSSFDEFKKHAEKNPYDFLFSIANGEILPEAILNTPKFFAINYHNGPLPKYAGLYATSWAILNGETKHAISWHKMQEKVDAGEILSQVWFPIAEDDTALTLNLKCYEHAIQAFSELIESLPSNLSPLPQDLSFRSYYGLKNKPANLGFISWEEPAEQIDRLCRAFIFDGYLNELVTPKIFINDEIFVIKSYRKLGVASGGEPGIVVHISSNELQVTTGTTDIALYELVSLVGKPCPFEELVKNHGIIIGCRFPKINKALLLARRFILPELEKFWVKENQRIIQESELFLSQLNKESVLNRLINNEDKIQISSDILEKFHSKFEGPDVNYNILALILIYFYRLNNYQNFSIEFSPSALRAKLVPMKSFLSNYLPLTTHFENEMKFSDGLTQILTEVKRLESKGTFSKDIFLRYPLLREPECQIEISVTFFDIEEELLLIGDKKLNIYISNDGSAVYIHHNNNYHHHEESYEFFKNIQCHLLTLLNDVIQHPNKCVYELSFIGEKELDCLLFEWNNSYAHYQTDELVQNYFEKQAEQKPDFIAATFEDKLITYKQLDQKASQIAHYLVSKGVVPNEIVGIYAHRSIEMLIGILGIIKSGAAYLPLDPHYPEKRLQYMVKNSQSNYVLTTTKAESTNLKFEGTIIEIEKILACINLELKKPKIKTKSSDLVYVIYTSGTTGTPKGVAISHRATCNHMLWMWNKFKFDEKDVFLQKTPFSFDASVWELFMPLFVGAKLSIAPDDVHASPQKLIRLVQENKVSILQLVPSMIRELTLTLGFKKCVSLRHLFSGGEVLLPETIHSFFELRPPNTMLHNLYGPTETTIDAITWTCTPKDAEGGVSRIGRPISNMQAYILDDKMQPVPGGIIGELYLSGKGLSKGYIHQPALTELKFLPHPFSTNECAKIYKTGDLAKWQKEGVIEYHGRRDCQLKIRGFRVEVSEIESCLEKIPFVYQCLVKSELEHDGSYSLCAYLVIVEDEHLSARVIRDFLKKELPDYMIPSRFYVVEKLLTTPSGKLDRRSIPAIERQLLFTQEYISPQNMTEQVLHDIWCSVLKKKKLSVHDDFFEKGGHSLSAMQIIMHIQEKLSIKLPMKTLFDFPNILELSREIEKHQQLVRSKCVSDMLFENIIIPIKASGYLRPLFLIHPIGGSIFWYKSLSKYFDENRPLYGIQDPSLDRKELIFASLEEMAEAYVKAMENIQPEGPYLLGGASFGTTVAIEMARQLLKKGEDIISIISLDGWAEYPAFQSGKSSFNKAMEKQNREILGNYMGQNANFILELQWHREKMLMNYKLSPIESKLLLFKSEELTEMFNYSAPLNWWDNYTLQDIDCYTVPGNHESMFDEPNVKILGMKLSKSIGDK